MISSRRGWAQRGGYGCGLALLMVIFVFPLLWMVSYSLRPIGAPPPTRLELFSPPYAFGNYWNLYQVTPIARFLLNSLRIIAIATPLTLLTGSWAGFAISQLPRRLQLSLIGLSIGLLLVPSPSVWIPRFILFTQVGWIDTPLPLIAPALMGTNPFYVLMFFVTFARISHEVFDSARLDGAGPWQVWWHIGLPLARPTVAAIAVLSLTDYWSNYTDPLLYLRSEANFTLPVGIKLLELAYRSNWPLLMAASVIMVAPVVALFLASQRLFLQRPATLTRWLR